MIFWILFVVLFLCFVGWVSEFFFIIPYLQDHPDYLLIWAIGGALLLAAIRINEILERRSVRPE